MIGDDFLAALPLIVLAASAIIVMLGIAIRRNHLAVVLLTLTGLAATMATLPFARHHSPRAITPLLVQDTFALFFTGVFAAAAAVSAILSYRYLASRTEPREEYYLLLLLATLGAAVLASSRHLATLFLGLELLSVSLYALVAYPLRNPRSLEASLKYLVLAGLSSAFLLFGMALLYADLGTLAVPEMARAPQLSLLAIAGLGLVVVGTGFKLSLVPFHFWTPDVFEGAPAPVGGFLASVSKGAVAALLMRLFLDLQAYRFDGLMAALAVVAFASMLAGNFLALLQDNVKRVLAYSSIAHVGYLLVALLVGGEFGTEALIYYIVAYAVMNLGAFAVVSTLSWQREDGDADDIEHYRGLFWQRPWLAAFFAVVLLSLAGIPLTVGFIAKFYVFAAGIDAGRWLLVAGVVVGTAIGIYYYLRIAVILFLPGDTGLPRPASSALDNAILALLAFCVIALGVYPAPLTRWIQATVSGMV